jgi:hypothetical protein
MPQSPYLSTDPHAGAPVAAAGGYLSTDPNAGHPAAPPATAAVPADARPAFNMFGVPTVIEDLSIGAVKGAEKTLVGLGDLAHRIPIVRKISDKIAGKDSDVAFDAVRNDLAPANTAQKIGQAGEQILEYFVPAGRAEKIATSVASKLPKYLRLLPEMAAQSATGAGVAAAQGNDPTTAALSGAAMPLVAAPVAAGLKWAGAQAEPLVRAAIKPTVTAMKRIAGASATGIDVQANRLVQFVIENKVTTAAKARAIFEQTENELKGVLGGKNPATDAPQRAVRYLQALERSASRQGLPAADVATIRNAAAEVLESGMGKDVVTMVPTAHPTLVGPNGQPITVLTPQTSRALRTDVTATESLERARANSQWDTRKAYGEQKGAQMESSKAVERAQRDAVKTAVPEAKPLLAREGQALQAEKVLDRMEFRAANRDAVSLPAHVMAAGELASGRLPILAFAANWLRNNQLKAGLWADALRKGIASDNAKLTGEALRRLGVAVPAEVGGQR